MEKLTPVPNRDFKSSNDNAFAESKKKYLSDRAKLGEWLKVNPEPSLTSPLYGKWRSDHNDEWERIGSGKSGLVCPSRIHHGEESSCVLCRDVGMLNVRNKDGWGYTHCPGCWRVNVDSRIPEARLQQTFKSFNLDAAPGMGKAYDVCRLWANKDWAEYVWVVLSGPCGVGKTHLAYAAAQVLAAQGMTVRFYSVPEMLDIFRSLHKDDQNFYNFFNTTINMPVLILDDLGTQRWTEFAEEKLYHLVDHRYAHKLKMLITTNARELPERIASRLKDGEIGEFVRCHGEDYRQRSQKRGDNG